MPRLPITDTAFLKKARDRFKLANDADTNQAAREREDLAFYAGDQWPADLKLARMGQQPNNGMPAIPARPTLVINKVREPVRQVQNEIRESDIGVELTPADDFGDLGITPDDTEITLREGLIRRIIRDSKGQDAWNWAGDRADIAGRGYFAILPRYLPGKTNDQEIYIERIFNQASVVGDPSRTEPDGSDSGYWFWGAWILADRFVAEYPKDADGNKNPFCDANDAEFMAASESYPTWVKQGDDEAKTWSVRVLNYLYTEYESKDLITGSDGAAYWEEELPDGVTAVDRRTVVEKKFKFCKIGGGVVELERTDLPTTEMPMIETIGEELHPYDEQRRIEGMVRNARDAQMGENYLISKFVETVGLAPIPRDTIDPEGIDGYEDWWNLANTRTLPYRPYRSYNDQGQPIAKPSPPNVDPNILPMAQGIQMFDQFVKSTTAVPDPTLGNVDPSLKSGRAIRETVANAKGSTSNFLTNRMRSIRRACDVSNSYLYPVYGQRDGRLVRVMTGEGASESMQIGDSSQGQQAQQQGASIQQKAAKVAKLTKDAKFNIAVKITKNFDTRRQQENSELGQLISAEPTLMTWFGDLYLQSGDTPNRKMLAERAKMMLAPPIQKMLAAKESGQEPLPPQVEAQMAQMGEQLKHAEAAIGEMQKAIDSKQVEQQGKLEDTKIKAQLEFAKSQQDAQLQLELQRMKDATTIRVAEIAAESKGLLTFAGHEHEADALNRSQEHEAGMSEAQRQHDAQMAAQGMAHEQASAEGTQDFDAEQSEAGRMAAAQEGQANRDAAAEQAAMQQASAQGDGAGV